MHVDLIDTEWVLVDYAINAVIPGLTDCTASIFGTAAVAHLKQQGYNRSLKESWGTSPKPINELVGNGTGDAIVCSAKDFFWRGFFGLWFKINDRISTRFSPRKKALKFGKSAKHIVVNFGESLTEETLPGGSYAKVTSLGCLNQTGLFQPTFPRCEWENLAILAV